MHFILKRLSSTANGTFGILMDIHNHPTGIVTLEDAWMNNQRTISCIPEGTYECKKYSGTKFKDVWELQNVENRSAILIHVGNTIDNTEGCILVGLRFGKARNKAGKTVPGIIDSKDALTLLKKLTGNKDFTLHVEEEYVADHRIGSGTDHLKAAESPADKPTNG